MDIKPIKIVDSLYGNKVNALDSNAIYYQIEYKRDKSSFAGIGFKIIPDKNAIIVRAAEEEIVQEVNKYEKLYMGCDLDYINAIKEVFSMNEKTYGIEILFLIYSSVRSSQIIFKELMENMDKNIDNIKKIF